MLKKLLIVAVLTIGAVSIAHLVLAASASSLSDNFDDNVLDTGKWLIENNQLGTSTETGRVLVLHTKNSLANSYSVVFGNATYNLTNDIATVQFIQGGSGSQDTLYQWYIDGSNGVKFIWSGGTLYARKTVADVDTDSTATVAPGPNTWLRFRETGGTLYWEYSIDNQANWTTLRSEADPINLTAVTPQLQLYQWAATAGPTNAVFDNFNIGVCDPTTTYCQTVFAIPGYGEWTVPAGVTNASVACWGGGAGGGDGSTSGGGAGGGGGAFASTTLTVMAGTKYTVFVGAGGAGGGSGAKGSVGATSTFATTSVIATPGQGGSINNGAGGVGGLASTASGTVKFAGGNGGAGDANGSAQDTGGGGGGAGGPHGAGVNGSIGAATIGGAGGRGNNSVGGLGGVNIDNQPGDDGDNHGLGGGGASGGDDGTAGGMGGAYGGGGGGGEFAGAYGAAGACVVSYSGTAPVDGGVTTNPYNTIIFE